MLKRNLNELLNKKNSPQMNGGEFGVFSMTYPLRSSESNVKKLSLEVKINL